MTSHINLDSKIRRVLIFAFHSEGSLPVIRALSSVGIECYVASRQNLGMHRFSKYYQGGIFVKGKSLRTGDDKFVKKVNAFIQKKKIEVLIGTDTDTTRMLIKCCSLWKGAKVFPGPDLALYDKLHDKWNFAELINQLNLPQPESQLISQTEDLDQTKLVFPILLKPLVGAGGIGIQKIENSSSLDSAMQDLKTKNGLPIIAQEYIDGQDIDLNFLSEKGNILAWSIQQRSDSQKGLISFLVNEEVLTICKDLVHGCQYTGIGHIDLRIDKKDDKVKFIEINPRFWASLDYSTAMGLNFPYLSIQLLTKQSIKTTEPIIGDCPYLPISLMALVRKIVGRGMEINQENLKKWAKYLWSDPVPELMDEIRRRFRKIWRLRT